MGDTRRGAKAMERWCLGFPEQSTRKLSDEERVMLMRASAHDRAWTQAYGYVLWVAGAAFVTLVAFLTLTEPEQSLVAWSSKTTPMMGVATLSEAVRTGTKR